MPAVNGVMEPLENNTGSRWDGLRARTLSAIAMAVITLLCVSQGGLIFIAFVILLALLTMKEWENLTEYQMLILQLGGYPYIIFPCTCLIWLRNLSTAQDAHVGLVLVIALMAVISATDIGAYFTGKRIGRHKLAPAISPKKTWEGLMGGVTSAGVVALLFSPYIHIPHSAFYAIAMGVFIGVLAQIGDLFKSWVKRLAGVKDSGNLIPGHGGILDRLDGYMFTTPLLALIVHCAL
jgi:phosphatidate cytidylyltransferase